jgi:drug/metabolite transporter (DMT)-like permease
LTPKWLLYVLLAFWGGGGCSVFQKDQQLVFGGAYKNEFMIIALSITFITLLIFAFSFEKKSVLVHAKRGLVTYVLCGAANVAVNYFVMVLSNRMNASVMFPIISAGGILTSGILSLTVYREKLSNLQKIGFVLGILAIVVLNI